MGYVGTPREVSSDRYFALSLPRVYNMCEGMGELTFPVNGRSEGYNYANQSSVASIGLKKKRRKWNVRRKKKICNLHTLLCDPRPLDISTCRPLGVRSLLMLLSTFTLFAPLAHATSSLKHDVRAARASLAHSSPKSGIAF